ncbi:transposase [Chryseobacterium sp. DT-3]|uniref:transposase n=1 Tax=Chryseobacterium sp. DT-3 TaxID=3396164 RepID=UPI003F1D5C9D
MNFKHIHIGNLIKQKVEESQIDQDRICKFLRCNETEVQKMYNAQNLDCDIVLRWSKLLEYDFFRIYSQHLILFAPQQNARLNTIKTALKSELPEFKKNIYTVEIINFIIEQITSGQKTRTQVMEQYNIPRSTLYRWLIKFQNIEADFIN